MLGTDPMASTACVERTTRPSSQRTTTPSGVAGRGRWRSPGRPSAACTPRCRKSSSSTAATSGSLPGSTCWRDTTSVTLAPNDENMCTNSTPVTPDPMTVTDSRERLGRVAVAGREDAVAVGRAPLRDARPGAGRRPGRRRTGSAACPRRRRPRPRGGRRTGPCRGPSARPGSTAASVTPACRWLLDALDARRQRLGVDLGQSPARGPSPSSGAGTPSPRRWRSSSSTGCSPSRWAAPPMTSRSIIVTSAPKRGGVRGGGVAGRATADDHEASRHDVQARHWPRMAAGASEAPTPTQPVPSGDDRRGDRDPSERPLTGARRRPADRQRAGRRAGPPPGARSTPSAAAGGEPYPYRFDRTHTRGRGARRVARPRARRGDRRDEVSVAGRVILKRDTGKLVFATIADRGAEIQLFVSKAVIGDDGFADVKELDRGDWVGAHGTVMTTRAGELSVKVDRLRAAGQVAAPAARQVARPVRPRHPLPPALRRPHRQRRGPPGVRRPPRGDRQLPPHVPATAASSRSRRRCSTSRPAAPTPARSSPTTTRSTCRCTCASPSSCTSSG